MTDEELLEWYKNNSNNKPVNMSDKDYELNVNKALKLQQDKNLKQTFDNQKQAIDTAQSQAQQSASISNEKLMKYLNQRQMASGTASGQQSSEFINANNAYVQNRATISNNTANQQTQLLENYNNQKLANQENAINNENNIIEKYRSREIEDENLQAEREAREREVAQWELEMDAYKQSIAIANEEREDEKQAVADAEDLDLISTGNELLNQMYSKLMQDDGTLTSTSREKMKEEIEKLKPRFNSEKNYEKLLDLYKIMTY